MKTNQEIQDMIKDCAKAIGEVTDVKMIQEMSVINVN